MLAAHIHGQPALISQYQPSASPDFTEFVSRMIHRDPAQRFQNASEALAALENHSAAEPDGLDGRMPTPGRHHGRSEDWPIYFLSIGIIILAIVLLWE